MFGKPEPRVKQRRAGVSPALHRAVVQRDGVCVASRFDPAHVCADQWGRPHAPWDLEKLTVDHVHLDGGTMGKRAEDDMGHLVAMCAAANIGAPSHELRAFERAWLARLS